MIHNCHILAFLLIWWSETCYFSTVYICIFSESKDLFFGLKRICISCSLNHIFMSFAEFSVGLPVIFLLICRSSLHREISPLPIANIFSMIVLCVLNLLVVLLFFFNYSTILTGNPCCTSYHVKTFIWIELNLSSIIFYGFWILSHSYKGLLASKW